METPKGGGTDPPSEQLRHFQLLPPGFDPLIFGAFPKPKTVLNTFYLRICKAGECEMGFCNQRKLAATI
jgi:hypothetical protein